MTQQDNRQVLVTLATSVLIFCILHPYPGFICMGLESLICLLLFALLMLFIAKQGAALYDLVLASASCFVELVSVDAQSRRLIDDLSADTFSISDPVLPFRFQIPPPTLST